MAVYKFNAVENENENENENEEISGKQYKVSKKESKKSGKKFRMDIETERASIFLQFLILYGRNFKASMRNMVSETRICTSIRSKLFSWSYFVAFFIALYLCANLSTFVCGTNVWLSLPQRGL